MKLILTIDVGTSAIKVGLFDTGGNYIDSDFREYKLQTPSKDLVELNPDIYWEATRRCIKKILDKNISYKKHFI